MAPRGRKLDSKGTTRFSRGAVSKKTIKTEPGCKFKKPAQFEQWIYRFLDHLCAAENKNDSYIKPKVEPKPRSRSRSSKQYRAPTPYTWDNRPTSSIDEEDDRPSGSHFSDEDVCLREENLEDLKFLISRARNVSSLVPDRSSDHNLLQKINLYIKAGLAEGKRRAKRYVRRALSFALDTGYVVQMDDDGMVFRVSPALLTDDEKVNTKLPPDSPNPANTPETSSKSNSSGSTKKRGRSRAPTKRRASTSGRKRRGGSTNKRAAKRTYKRKNGTSGEKERTCPHHKPDENKKEESKQPGTGGDGSSTTPTGTTPNQQQPPRNFKDNKTNEPAKKVASLASRNSSRNLSQEHRNDDDPHDSEDRKPQCFRARTTSSSRDKK